MAGRPEEIFTDAFYEERGQVEGSLGAVPVPHTVSDVMRTGLGSSMSYSGGGSTELTVAPQWLVEARQKALAQLALSSEKL